jgi:aspartate 1-decarboxylase
MMRQLLLGKIHRATVTRADLHYSGSITLDPLLSEAAGFLEHEKIDIYDVTNGSRLSTYVIPGLPGSGEVGINGAAAHLVKPGDLVILAAYGWITAEEAVSHRPKIVFVDQNNHILCIEDREQN